MGPSRLVRHAILASAAIAVLIAAIFVAVLFTVSDVRRAGDESREHERTVSTVDRAERHLRELADGLSGYAITRRPEFVNHWESGRRTLPADVAQVARLAGAEPGQRVAVAQLQVQTSLFLAVYGRPEILAFADGPRSTRVAGALAARRQINAMLATLAEIRTRQRAQAEGHQADREAAGARALLLGTGGAIASALLIAALATYLVRRVIAPVRQIVPAAERLAAGDRSARIEPTGHSDVRLVAGAFNAMADDLERELAALDRALEDLRHLAEHDALTGLLNRRALARELARQCGEVARYGPRGAVVLLDVDRFKAVNDGFGHATGDEVIVWIAEILRSRLRATDQLARLGGDEFAIVLPEGGREEAELVASTIVAGVRNETLSPRGTCPGGLTVSVGVAVFEGRENPTPEEMLSDADWAMYDAKAAGRDGYAIAEPRATVGG